MQPIKVIALASGKGGTSKTTMALALAVQAESEGARVMLFDADAGQGSLGQWASKRLASGTLRLSTHGNTVEDVREGYEAPPDGADYWHYLIVDTPGDVPDVIDDVIKNADFIIIPLQASPIDERAAMDIVGSAEEAKKPFCFVITRASEAEADIEKVVAKRLGKIGPVLKTRFQSRPAWKTAYPKGKSAAEIGDAETAKEVASIWRQIKSLMAKELSHG